MRRPLLPATLRPGLRAGVLLFARPLAVDAVTELIKADEPLGASAPEEGLEPPARHIA